MSNFPQFFSPQWQPPAHPSYYWAIWCLSQICWSQSLCFLTEVIIHGEPSWSNNFSWDKILVCHFYFPILSWCYSVRQATQNKKAKFKGERSCSKCSCNHLCWHVQVHWRLSISWVNVVCTLESPGNLSCLNMLQLLPANEINFKLLLTESGR